MDRIQKNIRHLRETRGVTKSKLAAKIGKTPTSISDYETGRALPPLTVLQEIADFFGVPVARMVAEDLWITAPDGRVEEALTDADRRMAREKELLHREIDQRMQEIKTLAGIVANYPGALESLKEINPKLAKEVQRLLKE